MSKPTTSSTPSDWLDDWFAEYIEDRRRRPREDVLTRLALAAYPDGSTPDVTAVVRTATFLFAAGQETTARLLAVGLKYLCEYPELQDELRAHPERIPDFIEETLRIESPVKADFRLARRASTIGGVDIGPGTPVMLLNGAANRDPRRFECPAEFRLDRPNAKDHIAFGRGAHPALAARWRGWKAGSALSGSSTACGTSGCPRPTTVHPAIDASSTSRRGFCGACTSCISNSPLWSRRSDEPRGGPPETVIERCNRAPGQPKGSKSPSNSSAPLRTRPYRSQSPRNMPCS